MGLFSGLTIEIVKDYLKHKVFTKKNLHHVKAFFYRRQKYYDTLRMALSGMPFIYKDFDAEVLADFQDVEVKRIASKNLLLLTKVPKTKVAEVQSVYKSFNVFNEYKKILIVGNAGVGKSTLMRHVALNMIDKKNIPYLKYDRKTLPIFIQLKALFGNSRSPIITYLLEKVTLFNHKKGKDILLRMSRKRQLLFILDGYDEISFVGGEEYLKYELSVLFSSYFQKSHVDFSKIKQEYIAIYQQLCDCKVWLTSREEFYRLNPLESFSKEASDIFLDERNFQVLNIIGLGNLRFNFVKKIFDKQKLRSEIFRENLDPELFMSEIDKLNDNEMLTFTEVPLFLTIMCYIYINRVRESKTVVNIWSASLDNLVYDCIETLFRDIDEYKVKDLSVAQKLAFLRRRNDYTNEKIEFLEFLAYTLLIEQKPIFYRSYLIEKAYHYFDTRQDEEGPRNVIKSFNINKDGNPDFCEQLIYSGVFTTVGIISDDLNYDFPHRRFREVLAAKYLEKQASITELINHLHEKHLSEFVVYFFAHCNNSQYQSQITTALLNASKTDDFTYGNSLLCDCLSNRMDDKFHTTFSLMLKDWVKRNIRVRMKKELFNLFKPSEMFSDFLLDEIDNVDSKKGHSIGLVFALQYCLYPTFFREKGLMHPYISSELTVARVLYLKYHFLSFANQFGGKRDTDSRNLLESELGSILENLNNVEKALFLASIPFNKTEATEDWISGVFKTGSFTDQLLLALACKGLSIERFGFYFDSQITKRSARRMALDLMTDSKSFASFEITGIQHLARLKQEVDKTLRAMVGEKKGQLVEDQEFLKNFLTEFNEKHYNSMKKSIGIINDKISFIEDVIV